jgi:hypothetical protein
MSRAPGTIVRELEIDPPDRPAVKIQTDKAFQDTVYYIRDLITQLETGGKPA